MRTVFLLLVILFGYSLAGASELPTVNTAVFKKGSYWIWAYSEFDKDSNQWLKPYLYEKYTVTQVSGNDVTMEMSSDSELGGNSPAHHKFKANIQQCLESGKDFKKLKNWKIAFYTKSFGPQWELVSNKHQGTPFTEKFNCLSQEMEIATEFIEWNGELWEIFNYHPSGKGSWYFYGHPQEQGVTQSKGFSGYKMELIESQK